VIQKKNEDYFRGKNGLRPPPPPLNPFFKDKDKRIKAWEVVK
jgi:hypothetical protein